MCCKICWFLEMRGFGVLLNAKVSLLLAKNLQIPRKKKRSSIWHDLDNHEHYKSSIVIVPLETMFHRTQKMLSFQIVLLVKCTAQFQVLVVQIHINWPKMLYKCHRSPSPSDGLLQLSKCLYPWDNMLKRTKYRTEVTFIRLAFFWCSMNCKKIFN